MVASVELGSMHSGTGALLGALSRGYLSVILAKSTNAPLSIAARFGSTAISAAAVSNTPGDAPCDVTDLAVNFVPREVGEGGDECRHLRLEYRRWW